MRCRTRYLSHKGWSDPSLAPGLLSPLRPAAAFCALFPSLPLPLLRLLPLLFRLRLEEPFELESRRPSTCSFLLPQALVLLVVLHAGTVVLRHTLLPSSPSQSSVELSRDLLTAVAALTSLQLVASALCGRGFLLLSARQRFSRRRGVYECGRPCAQPRDGGSAQVSARVPRSHCGARQLPSPTISTACCALRRPRSLTTREPPSCAIRQT